MISVRIPLNDYVISRLNRIESSYEGRPLLLVDSVQREFQSEPLLGIYSSVKLLTPQIGPSALILSLKRVAFLSLYGVKNSTPLELYPYLINPELLNKKRWLKDLIDVKKIPCKIVGFEHRFVRKEYRIEYFPTEIYVGKREVISGLAEILSNPNTNAFPKRPEF